MSAVVSDLPGVCHIFFVLFVLRCCYYSSTSASVYVTEDFCFLGWFLHVSAAAFDAVSSLLFPVIYRFKDAEDLPVLLSFLMELPPANTSTDVSDIDLLNVNDFLVIECLPSFCLLFGSCHSTGWTSNSVYFGCAYYEGFSRIGYSHWCAWFSCSVLFFQERFFLKHICWSLPPHRVYNLLIEIVKTLMVCLCSFCCWFASPGSLLRVWTCQFLRFCFSSQRQTHLLHRWTTTPIFPT